MGLVILDSSRPLTVEQQGSESKSMKLGVWGECNPSSTDLLITYRCTRFDHKGNASESTFMATQAIQP